jgi:Thioredoxin-like
MRLTACVLALALLPAAVRADDAKKDAPPKKDAPSTSAQDALKAGLAKAKGESKLVFLIFSTQGCGWCKLFDKFHDDADVQRLLTKRYVFVKVDAADQPGGEEMYKKYAHGGVPYWVVLDPAEKMLIDADDGKKGNVGFPYEPHEIDHYVKALKQTYPSLTAEEIDLLVNKLKALDPKKKEDK